MRLFQSDISLLNPIFFCFSAMGNCGLYFRDRIETFDLTEAELNVENNKDQTENERVI